MPAPFFSQSSGLIRIALSGSGWATRLYRSGVYNIGSVSLDDLRMSFAADQFLVLSFEQAAERLSVTSLGAPSVSVNYGGPFAGEVKALARNEIATQIQANVAGAVSQAQSQLNGLTAPARKSALIDQLRRIDEAAGARFDEAVFRQDGVILRGTISLTPRYAPHVSFEKTAAGDGFDAIESWIPGGRVDTFEWTWRWFTNPVEAPPGPPGSSSEEHSFLLRRPQGPRSKFGLMLSLDNPLPGLDGSGRVCLAVRGVHVDHVTGAPVPIESAMECAQFGYEFKMPYEVGPYVRICDPLRAIAERPAPEIGILRVGVSEAPEAASNTLVLYLDRTWSEEAASTLRAGLESCRRENAGLLVLVLFRDGVLNAGDPELQARLQELSTSLAAPMLVNEDVRGGWSKVLALPTGRGELAWRLITPAGVVSWVHHGRADAELLASVLDERLVASRQASLVRVRPDFSIGGRVPIDLVVRPCPPVPLSRPGTAGSKLVFVQKGHSSSLTQLERLGREYPRRGEDKPFDAIVVDGADAEEAEALRRELNLDFPAFPDPDGTLTRRAGVPFAPTIITLDEDGRVTGCEMGVAFSGDGDGDLEHGE
jgi:hypothetical protein